MALVEEVVEDQAVGLGEKVVVCMGVRAGKERWQRTAVEVGLDEAVDMGEEVVVEEMGARAGKTGGAVDMGEDQAVDMGEEAVEKGSTK
uniref:Uncharacterized protein n=1 Tax=Pithovirus LCPAC304 TaxID=2506594 RepID=A0A481Z967_9VIRU|nr:MAG: hypothetical protein LCPAC304_06940 [Pithovirus LCPAC304]